MSQSKEELIKEAKQFKKQVLIFCILHWLFSIFILFIDDKKDLFIIPVAAVIFTIIYLQMKYKIKQYEKTRW